MKTSIPSSSLSSIPGARLGNPAGVGPSKFTYRYEQFICEKF